MANTRGRTERIIPSSVSDLSEDGLEGARADLTEDEMRDLDVDGEEDEDDNEEEDDDDADVVASDDGGALNVLTRPTDKERGKVHGTRTNGSAISSSRFC
ncbi:unnamed protein product [Nippostrongylus brasiliensis]|uniref:CHZ domain-containing protein n=1 Tax=Nippostrongylus brasiliensis TaxID=27835 RepID=A0A0N4Y982_NIPBR|nr:unnamed protein product [Nippostrongylus brasiliensis]